MKKVAISQSNYIPWKGFFDAIHSVDAFIFYDDMQYTRQDWRNRNRIKTAQGVQWITVPVKANFLQKINQTLVSDPAWAERHWKTIAQSYAGAACFKAQREAIEALYLENKSEHLSEINIRFTERICELLGIHTQLLRSSDFELVEGKTERLVDLCKKLGATEYWSGPAAKVYLDEGAFTREGMSVHYFDYSGYPEYRQQHGSFVHEVSILDLLFNEGADAPRFMKSFR